ncbi:MAG: PBSX family phage terminase large subunit [Clostridiales bacterium]|nr:PBSX family phage terminase large subunit [Clostridiales bacterium]
MKGSKHVGPELRERDMECAGEGFAAPCMPRRILVPARAINPCYRPFLTAPQRVQIFFGGAGSGKSVFLAQRCVLDALCGRNTLVVRQVARTLRTSCFNEVRKAAARLGLSDQFQVHQTDMRLTCLHSGAQVLFLGLDDVEKIKSVTPRTGVLTDIWVEEATECRYADIKQLQKRLRGRSRHPKRLTLSFNPVHSGHWIYRQWFLGWAEGQRQQVDDDLLILRTTHEDNVFLSEADRRAYRGEQDPYFHRVYTLGEWGQQSGAIFTNWSARDLTAESACFDRIRLGLDFGFAADPAAMVRLHWDGARRTVYVLEARYCHGYSNAQLARQLQALAGDLPVYCDSAEPKSIAELRRLGVCALPVRKGPDSLRHGIRFLQGCRIVVHQSCVSMMEELQGYRWRQDGHRGDLPIPQGADHLIDALRYALEADMRGGFAQAVPKDKGV